MQHCRDHAKNGWEPMALYRSEILAKKVRTIIRHTFWLAVNIIGWSYCVYLITDLPLK